MAVHFSNVPEQVQDFLSVKAAVCRHLSSGHGRRDGDSERPPQLTVQGFNATRIAAVQQSGASQAASQHPDQVNILNLPLPEILKEEGMASRSQLCPQGECIHAVVGLRTDCSKRKGYEATSALNPRLRIVCAR